MALYLLLVTLLTAAAFVMALRLAEWLRLSRGVSADVATGLFMVVFIIGLIAVGAFVGVGANLTDTGRLGAGLFVQAVLGTVLLPVGILRLKKNEDFT